MLIFFVRQAVQNPRFAQYFIAAHLKDPRQSLDILNVESNPAVNHPIGYRTLPTDRIRDRLVVNSQLTLPRFEPFHVHVAIVHKRRP
jgi:hypothetical protein